MSVTSVQPEPEGHVGAGEAEGGARQAQSRRPGEEPPDPRADVTHASNFHVSSSHSAARFTFLCALCNRGVFYLVQGAAGPTGAGQTGPEGTGGDRGQLSASYIYTCG